MSQTTPAGSPRNRGIEAVMESAYIPREIFNLLPQDFTWNLPPDTDVGVGPWCNQCGRELLNFEGETCEDCLADS